MSNLPSTINLIDEYTNLQIDRDIALSATPDEDRASVGMVFDIKIQLVINQLMQKADNIYYVKRKIESQCGAIDGEIEVLQNEIQRLKKRKQSMENAWKRIEERAIMLIETVGEENSSGNKVLRTNAANYTVVNRDGKLDLIDASKVPEDCVKVEVSYDNAELRKRVIAAGGKTEYGIVPKTKSLLIK